MQNLFLIATIAGTDIAISCEHVESVVHVGEVIHVPQSDPLVAGLFALRSRVLTLIDCQYAVTGTRDAVKKDAFAIVAMMSGHPYGLLVEEVKDVVSADAATITSASRLDKRWNAIASEIVEVDGRALMLLSPEALLASKRSLAA